MNFGALPPEVNSALMYSGAGSGPIRAAATAWKNIAAELHTAAQAYHSIVTELTSQTWHGPSAAAMATAAAPYTAWMATTATQAGHAGTQAEAAASAYEIAHAMTVPPAVIAANRAQLATLIATNILGHNTAAIAATEAHYSHMWAQDATAMYDYASNAAAATQLSTFTTPQPTTTGSAEDTGSGSISPGLMFDIASSVLSVGSVGPFGAIGLGGAFGGLAMTLGEMAFPESAGGLGALGALGALGLMSEGTVAAPAVSLAGAHGVGTAWAEMGKAMPVGGVSVPRTWAVAAPVSMASAHSGADAAAAVPAASIAKLPFTQMALAGAAGRALAGGVGVAGEERRSAVASQPTVVAAPKRDGDTEEPTTTVSDRAPSKVIGVVAELRALVELRDSGVLSSDKFEERKLRLLAE